MRTINDAHGNVQTLSDEIYIIEDLTRMQIDILDSSGYGNNSLVRMISGVDDSKIIGFHFNKEYVTVCSIFAQRAEFVGVKKNQLKLYDVKPSE